MADQKATNSAGRRTAVGALVALGAVLGVIAIFAVWVSRQALETDQWTETSSALLEEPVIQGAVAGFLVDSLYANVDVEDQLRQALPPRADPLAGPAAAALRRGAEDVAKRALARPQVQQAWEQANREAHELLVFIVEGGGDVVSTEEGVVTLNLKTLLDELVRRTGVGARAAARIPADAASVEVLRSDELGFAQTVAKSLKPLALVFVLLMLACFGGAIALSRGHRRQTLRACGFALLFAGVAALVIRELTGNTVVESLSSTAAAEPIAETVWEIATSFLVGVATATIAYGAFVVVGTWLAGPTRAATSVRRASAPYARELPVAYGVFAAVVLLVLLWAPTEGLRRLLPATLLILLTLAGFEVLRRLTVAEFPDAVRGEHGAALARVRGALQRTREPAEAGNGAPSSAPETAPTLSDAELAQLERLSALHRAGELDDAEYSSAKQHVLTRS